MIDVGNQTFRSGVLIQLANDAINFMNRTPRHTLPPQGDFIGSGVYMIFYKGNFAKYSHLSNTNTPIYVGKAVPTGWRTGVISKPLEKKLKSRLSEHARSINAASNLNLSDFECKFAIIPNDLAAIISVIESTMIQLLQPIWNTTIDGFGNHDPGSGRYQQARSNWDKLHPGRAWAEKLQ
ncbi:Eco29kI family restriction endonuclease [Marinibactrum halimedae]|uniref:Type II restriction-modification system endonuclease n=1 Tax=Marinibactrum halimedae TaxID=1444977 RepID=A0AA37TCB6_9GAMM|nr:Eco29kI family restriction endonuclease [Marinibactrum halimedae]MCD9458866.1 Eco29kI family restriction endonuclease [Marinibactrum halimedae]GLS27716.1 type II restriction-modification system endonuclease [Marinibactrum halimedae]